MVPIGPAADQVKTGGSVGITTTLKSKAFPMLFPMLDAIYTYVRSKSSNVLGLYNMSRNVREWTFTLNVDYQSICSGNWYDSADSIQIGNIKNNAPYSTNDGTGVRPVRSL